MGKMGVGGHTIFSKQYRRVKSRMSSAVRFVTRASDTSRFGIVETFIILHGIAIALLKPLPLSADRLNEECDSVDLERYSVCDIISYIVKVEVCDTLEAIDASCIADKVVYMRIASEDGDNHYIRVLFS